MTYGAVMLRSQHISECGGKPSAAAEDGTEESNHDWTVQEKVTRFTEDFQAGDHEASYRDFQQVTKNHELDLVEGSIPFKT
jgi:hypothetical protein